jgi:MFS family permease
VAALVPFFVSERAYTYAAAGIVLAASLMASVVQPLFGALTDKWAMPWLLPVSTMVGGAGVALAGVGDSYTLTLVVVAVSGVGIAAYHPEAARVARNAGRGSHTAMGWFSLGGNLGFATAPLMVSAVIATGGLSASPLLVVPTLAGVALCLAALRGIKAPAAVTAAARAGKVIGRDDWASFMKLSGAIVCRSIVFVGLSAFISLYVRQRAGRRHLPADRPRTADRTARPRPASPAHLERTRDGRRGHRPAAGRRTAGTRLRRHGPPLTLSFEGVGEGGHVVVDFGWSHDGSRGRFSSDHPDNVR